MSEVIDFGGFARISKTEENPEIVKKELLLDYIDNNQARARLKREIESLLLFESNRIVKILDFDNENFSWYTMPYYKSNLEVFYNEVDENEKTIIKIAMNILEAMLIIESKNMVHRDLKPNNILLNSVDDLVVCDFGLTKMKRDTVLTRTLQGMGTVYFSAPEQFENAKTVDIRADIYSFGRILTWLFTKQLTTNLNHEKIPLKYKSLIQKSVDQNPENRYKSVSELKRAFESRIQVNQVNNRKQLIENISNDSNSYVGFINMSSDALEKFTEEELYSILKNGKLEKWISDELDSFNKIYEMWEVRREQEYSRRRFYPATNIDSICYNFYKCIKNTEIPVEAKVSLFIKLINHWGHRYYVMDLIFELLTVGICDEFFYTYLSDSLSENDIKLLKDFYQEKGEKFNNISNHILLIIEN